MAISLNKPIVLTGMMGSGKTSTGKFLSQSLGLSFIDLDTLIEQNLGISISQIFQTKGEDFFRSQEIMLLDKVLNNQGPKRIIALGGGTLQQEDCLGLALDKGHLIYLKASPAILGKRLIKQLSSRPLIQDYQDEQSLNRYLSELLQKRISTYQKAPTEITTDNLTPQEVAFKILDLIKVGH